MKAHQNKTKWFFITLAAMTLLGSIPANAARGPSNDQFRKAIGITLLPFTNAQNTSAARFSGSEPDPSCQGTSHTVWYVLTPDADTTITANTFGSDYDTTLTVFTRSGNTFTEVACNDDFGGLQSQVNFSVTAGTTYYFQIGGCCGSDGESGNLVFNVSEP
jgi:hypothetical protein